MNIRAIAAAVFSALVVYATATVDHDKIEPFLQPEPMSEKAAIKFKPNLSTSEIVCVSFPAVNAAGGEFQDLIMWEQLTDIARMALNDSTNFENAEVPISDDHYEDHLDKAWPL
ncbi:NPP1 protein [Phytophthora nicotianae]|uniref:NPP1 protein n=1 Tax=Phytophthora nicotianae TaxID=4792 RepID=A0A0W8DBI1_PHYNI|nr:NPP1 protein [Phytophthora nicotianae]